MSQSEFSKEDPRDIFKEQLEKNLDLLEKQIKKLLKDKPKKQGLAKSRLSDKMTGLREAVQAFKTGIIDIFDKEFKSNITPQEGFNKLKNVFLDFEKSLLLNKKTNIFNKSTGKFGSVSSFFFSSSFSTNQAITNFDKNMKNTISECEQQLSHQKKLG